MKGFWLMCAVYIVCEAVIFTEGYDTFLWRHTTEVELKLQQKILEK